MRFQDFHVSDATQLVPIGGYSAEAAQYFARLTDPGTTRKNLLAAMIDGMVGDNVWGDMGALYIGASDIEANSFQNLKSSSFTLTKTNTVTFTADRGWTPDGTSGFLDTGAAHSSMGVSQDSAHLGAWVRDNANTTALQWGRENSSGRWTLTVNEGGIAMNARLGNAAVLTPQVSSPGGLSQGHTVMTRRGATDVEGYRNGSSAGTSNNASEAIGSGTAQLGRSNGSFYSSQIAAGHIGGGLTTAKALAIYNRLNTYLVAVGAA